MVVLLSLSACTGAPPAADTLFQDARALAATPDGTLWVVDADALLALRDGRVIRRIGGVGTGDDAFLDPVDVDPTNGQTIYVADRAAGAILQFTAEGRLVRSISVPDVDPADVVRQRPSSRLGQPVAVAAGTGGALYVAEAGRGHVLEFDSQGSVVRVIGAGLLREPTALLTMENGTLWVADSAREDLQAFDSFGTPSMVIDLAIHGRLVGLAIRGREMVVAAERTIQTLDVFDACGQSDCGRALAHLEGNEPVRGSLYGGGFQIEPYRGVEFVGARLLELRPTRLNGYIVGPIPVD